MLKLTHVMLASDQPAQALSFSEALLQRDPQSSHVLAIKSRAERDLGRNAEAASSARLAWRYAKTPAEEYDAAMVMAQALASDGSKFRAQFWLRRAIEVAPDDAARRAAERDFSYVRARSRLSARFDVSVQPSSNVNNGSSGDVLWFHGLPLSLSGDAQALSGTEASLGTTLSYRLTENENAKTDLVLSALHKSVVLSQDAKAQAPGAAGADYAYSLVEAGIERVWRPAAIPGAEARTEVTLGRNWYGGEAMSDYQRFEVGLSAPAGPNLGFRGRLAAEHQDRQDAAIRSADLWTVGLGLTTRTAAKDRLDFDLTLRSTQSDSTEIDHGLLRLDMGWSHRKPVLGARLGLNLWAEARDYDESLYTTDGRLDRSVGGTVSMAFDEIDYMGFIPVVTLNASRTESNVDLHDSSTLGIGLSIRSKF